jgi:hypothetical protein
MTKLDDRQNSTVALKSSKVAVAHNKSDDIVIHTLKDTDDVSVDLKNGQNGLVTEKTDAQPNQVIVMFGLLRKLIGVKDILALQVFYFAHTAIS